MRLLARFPGLACGTPICSGAGFSRIVHRPAQPLEAPVDASGDVTDARQQRHATAGAARCGPVFRSFLEPPEILMGSRHNGGRRRRFSNSNLTLRFNRGRRTFLRDSVHLSDVIRTARRRVSAVGRLSEAVRTASEGRATAKGRRAVEFLPDFVSESSGPSQVSLIWSL